MKLLTSMLSAALICVPTGMALAQGQKQEPPAARVGLSPADKTKVTNVLSRSMIHGVHGAREHANRTQQNVVSTTNNGGQGCVTNIGSPAASDQGQRQIGSRYGTSHNDQVLAVRGSIISVCK